MNRFELIGYPLLFISGVEFLLTFILLREKPNTPLHKITAAFAFFAASYCLFAGIVYVRASLGLDYDGFYRACWIGWIGIAPGFQLLYYIKEDKSRTGRRFVLSLYVFWIIIFVLSLFTDLVETGAYSLLPYVDRSGGPLENPARLVGAALIFLFIYELNKLRRGSIGIKRSQVNYLLMGILIYGAGVSMATGIFPLFGGFGFDPSLGSYFTLPWVALTVYAITRYRLFDVSLIISRALMIVFLTLVLAALQIGLFNLFEPVIGASLAILFSISLIGTIFFGTHLSRKVQWLILQFIVKHKYDYQEILKESIKAIITILDLDELLDYIIASMKKSLGVENICLFLKDKDGFFPLRYGEGIHREMGRECHLNDAAIDWLQHKGHVIVREEIESASYDGNLIISEFMKKAGAELIIPLVYKGNIEGFIALGQKGGGGPYVRSDIDLLELLAAHAAIAIENARLYDEARLSKASLLESESKFRTLADTASIAIFIHQGGKFLYTNHAAEIIGGYTVDEYLNMDFLSLAHPDYLDTIKARVRQRQSGGQPPIQHEFKIVRKDRKERWVLMTAGITEYEGRTAVIGTLVDITARKQAEEETERLFQELEIATRSLKESEAKFRTLAETTTAGIFIHRGAKFLYVNTAGEHLTGYKQDELLCMDYWSLVHPDYRVMAHERGQQRLAGVKPPQEYEFKIILKNGEQRWVNITAGIIEYQGSPAVLATLFDITTRKQAEEEREKFYEESVKQYQKRIEEEKRFRIEKEKILMDLHDGIGGITTNIGILSELALKASTLPDIKKTVSVISRLSKEGISEIRGFMHSLDYSDLNWRTLVAELRNQGTNMVEPHAITFALETSIDETHEQPGSLLWVNLFKIYKESLTNVIKHSRARNVKAKLKINQEKLLLLIEDDGVGLGEVNRGRGLSNMRTRAEELGGTVTILSNSGTQVIVELPLPVKYHD